jgi:hypothetical protein
MINDRFCFVEIMVPLLSWLMMEARFATPQTEHCLGEFILDAESDMCVLEANNGDPDEPLASHPKCG